MRMNRFVRFDWAAKNILRNRADFAIFEGFISVLVNDKVKIVELLDTESNQMSRDDKYNRVDIKAKNSRGEIIIVEIQQTREKDYLQRMLYGVAKTITEYMKLSDPYDNVKKVYSINILYFTLGEGTDYLYHGQVDLRGVHDGDTLQLTDYERSELQMLSPKDVFPEYYVIRVNEFNKLAVTPLEEWIQYLKDEYIRPDTDVPGLQEASQRLEYLRMSPEQQRAYEHYIDTLVRDTDVIKTQILEAEIAARKEGHAKGLAEGIAEGRAEGLAEGREAGLAEGREAGLAEGREAGLAEGRENASRETARRMKSDGLPVDVIAKYTGLDLDEINNL